MNQRALILLSIVLVVIAVGLGAYIVSTNQSTLNTSATGGGTPASCPSGTGMLFTGTSLTVGTDVNFGGKITQASGSWRMDNQNGVPMAIYGTSMKVEFANDVYMDTVLIFDNDPKSGENPWSINGKSLPTTGQDQWGPPFKLDITSKTMTFDYGGDSPHFNICISQPKPSSTKTPTPTDFPKCIPDDAVSGWPECRYGLSTYDMQKCRKRAEEYKGVSGPGGDDRAWFTWAQLPPKPLSCGTACGLAPSFCLPTPTPKPSKTPTPQPTNTPTPKPSNTPTPTPTKTPTPVPSSTVTPTHTPTPTPTLCITPKAVTDLKISCPLCQ